MGNVRPTSRLVVWLFSVFALLVVGCGRTDLVPDEYTDEGVDAATDSGGLNETGPLPDGSVDTRDAGDGRTEGGLDATADSQDGAVTVVGVAVTPPLVTLTVGTKAMLTATATFSDQSTLDVTSTATWSSDAMAVASVTQGSVVAMAPGKTTIRASFQGFSGQAVVTVPAATIVSIAVSPGQATTGVAGTVSFQATATLSDNSHQDVTTTATWDSSSPTVATVDNQGVATGVAAGNTTIRASVGSVSGQATLTVSGATLVSIAVTPTNPVVGVGVTFPFTAMGTYSDSSVADVTKTATWTSSDPSVVTITSLGSATTIAKGASVITAAIGNVSGSTSVTVTAATLVSIAVTPASSTLAIGGTVQLKATGTYSDNSQVELTLSATWSSSASGVASVSNASGSQGLVTALGAGKATITATFGTVSGSADVNVTAATLVSISITPPSPSVPKATKIQFIAKGTYSDNSVVDITTTATWSTDDSSIATISNSPGSNGLATAMNVGTTGVHATLDGVTGSTTITVTGAVLVSIAVTPANSTLTVGIKQFMKATGTYSDSSTVDLTTTAVWSTGDTNVASVSNAQGSQGLLTAMGPGTTQVTATVGTVSGSTSVTVSAPTLSQIVVTPIDPSRPAGQRIQFTAMAIYTDNTSRNVTLQATWTSSNTSVASMDGGGPGQRGLATTIAQGTTTITATYGGLSGSTTLTVTSAVLTSISVTPIMPSYPAGTLQQFQAMAIFSDNTSQNITAQATWQSTNPSVAGVSSTGGSKGRVTTLAAGTTDIQASWQGITGQTTLTVTSALLSSISVFPATVSVVAGTYRQFTAEAIYSDNTSKDVTGQATWTSSAPTVAQVSDVNPKGQAKALAAGTASIQASYGGMTGSATMTVTAATVVSIQVTPVQPSVGKGIPVRFQAVALMSDNTSQNVTVGATWISSDPSVATVSDAAGSKGWAQTLSAGTATITATWNGSSGSTTITVTGATLQTIQITPFSPTIPVGFTTDLVATGIYSDTTTQDLTYLATWVSSAPAVASVSDSGLTKGRLTPLKAGSTQITATYQGVTGTDTVTISSATLTKITVSPSSATVAVHGTQAFTAQGLFSDNSTMDVTVYVTWLSSTPSIADVSNAAGSHGVATGLSTGKVTVTAVRGSVSGTATLAVQ